MSDADSTAQTEYRPIPEWPGYFATNDGQIASCRATGRARHRIKETYRILKPTSMPNGYMQVAPSVNCKNVKQYVHRLVCAAFHGPCPAGMECCHSDGRRDNNRPANLRWGTPVENASDRLLHGTVGIGESNGFAKLSESDVREIRAMRAGGMSMPTIARHFNVCPAAIGKIVRGITWKHVT